MIESMRCPGCGTLVEIPEGDDARPTVTRDGMLAATPGRATIRLGDEVLHRCADGRFLPPDRSY